MINVKTATPSFNEKFAMFFGEYMNNVITFLNKVETQFKGKVVSVNTFQDNTHFNLLVKVIPLISDGEYVYMKVGVADFELIKKQSQYVYYTSKIDDVVLVLTNDKVFVKLIDDVECELQNFEENIECTKNECDIDLISDNIAFVSQDVLNNVINDCFGSEIVTYNTRLNLTFKLELDKKIVYFPLIKSQKHITFLIKKSTFFNHIDYFKMQKPYSYDISYNVNDNNILYILTDDVNFLSTDFKQSIFPEKSYIMEYGKFDFGELQQYCGKNLLSKYKTHKNDTAYVMFYVSLLQMVMS